jgi:hypothetical protein
MGLLQKLDTHFESLISSVNAIHLMSDIAVRAHPRGTREVLADICGGRLSYREKPSARLDAVAYGAEAGIGVFPRVRARDPDHLQICAAAKAQPLNDRQRGGARRILRIVSTTKKRSV